jgi:hypothetical protein
VGPSLNRSAEPADTSGVKSRRSLLAAGALAAVALLPGCSRGAATAGVGAGDAGAVRACSELRGLEQDWAAGKLGPAELRARVALVYQDAQTSADPVIRARAVALYADTTEVASGGDARRLDADFQAMDRACSGQPG